MKTSFPDHEISDGVVHATTDFNNFRLRTKQWNLCRDKDEPPSDMLKVDCPIKVGTNHYVKEKKIPVWTPKVCDKFHSISI